MTEHDLQNQIRMRLTRLGFAVFRSNVGKFRMANERWFDTGLPRGFSDLFAVRNGKIYFIEVKVKPNKPSPEQLNFIAQMTNRYGCCAGVAYCVEDAERICCDD